MDMNKVKDFDDQLTLIFSTWKAEKINPGERL